MQDWRTDAEALFRDFAGRHSFIIEKVNDPHVELLMRLPQQTGLSFELMLGLQNRDELNIGFDGFWSSFFPYEKKKDIVMNLLSGIASGDCRLAVHSQFGRVIKRVLEQRFEGSWREIYTELLCFKIPMSRTSVSYLYNEGARRQ